MRVKTKLSLLGTKLVQGKKDPTKQYMTVSFLDEQELDSINIMTDDPNVFNSVSGITDKPICECELDLKLGKYTNCRLVSCKPLEVKK